MRPDLYGELSRWMNDHHRAEVVQIYRRGPWKAEVLYLKRGVYDVAEAFVAHGDRETATQARVDQALLDGLKRSINAQSGEGHAVTLHGTEPHCVWCGTGTECDCYDRLVCEKAGEPLHGGCGWCARHRGPRWKCIGEHPDGERDNPNPKSISTDFLLDELQRCYDICVPPEGRTDDGHHDVRRASFASGFVADTVHACIAMLERRLAERGDPQAEQAHTLLAGARASATALETTATDRIGQAMLDLARAVAMGDVGVTLQAALALRAGVAAAREGA